MASQAILKTLVRGMYDVQKLRIQTGNRICTNFKAKLGQMPSQSEETLDEESKKILQQIRNIDNKLATGLVAATADDDEDGEEGEEVTTPGVPRESKADKKKGSLVTELIQLRYKKLTDGKKYIPTKAKFIGDAVISDYTEFCLVSQYFELEKQERTHFARLEGALEDFQIYNDYLRNIPGVGPQMAGVILSEIDITHPKCKYVSSLWSLAGLDVVQADNRGRSRRTEHLVKRPYITKDGKSAFRDSITFNPFLKTKLVGVLATSFLRAKDCPYATTYADYIHRLEGMYQHATWRLESGSNEKGFPKLISGIWKHNKTGQLVFQKPAKVAKPEATEAEPNPKAPVSPWTELKSLPESKVTGDGKKEPKIMTLGDSVWSYGKSRGHRHRMGLRYSVKIFLLQLFPVWKKIAGLPAPMPWAEAKQGLKHGTPDAKPDDDKKGEAA